MLIYFLVYKFSLFLTQNETYLKHFDKFKIKLKNFQLMTVWY